MKKESTPTPVIVSSTLAVGQILLFLPAIVGVLSLRARHLELQMVPWLDGYTTTQYVLLLWTFGLALTVLGLFPLAWETLIARKTKVYHKNMYRLWLVSAITLATVIVLLYITPWNGNTGV